MKKLLLLSLILLMPLMGYGAVDLSFLQTNSVGTNFTTYTFVGENLGTAASDRQIIVAISSRDSGESAQALASVTIGGVSATISVQRSNISTDTNVLALVIANVPTGTTGDIVVTFTEGMLRCGIAVYRATGISATPTDTGSSIVADPTFDIDVTAGGFAIGTSVTGDSGATATWTGITEDYEIQIGGESLLQGGASDTFGTTQTDLTLLCNWTGSEINPVGVFASWEGSVAVTRRIIIVQ